MAFQALIDALSLSQRNYRQLPIAQRVGRDKGIVNTFDQFIL